MPMAMPKGGSQKKKSLQMPTTQPKSTVSFSDIDLITSMPLATGSTFGSPPKRETSEYVPPDSFIQTMERPGPGRPGPGPGPGQKSSVLADLWG